MVSDKSPVLALDEAPTVSGSSGEQFCYTMFELAHTLGASQIGASVTKVPPGKPRSHSTITVPMKSTSSC